MLGKFKLSLLSLSLLSSVSLVQAENISATRIIIAPQCLLNQVHVKFESLAQQDGMRVIAIAENNVEALAIAKHHSKNNCGGFRDVTRRWQEEKVQAGLSASSHASALLVSELKEVKPPVKATYKIQYPEKVNQLLAQVNPQRMWENLTTLTQFPDRYSRSNNGVKAAQWLKDQVEALAKATHHDDVTVSFVKTGSYLQPSVVVKFGNSNEPGIVIGGHMDTLNSSLWSGNKPGADDDGSGTITVLETATTLLSSGMQFKKPIYFIWYAAEEMGLIGSDYVVKEFKSKNIPVAAVMQLDMTGFAFKNDPTMWLVNDYVNKDLTEYLETLIQTYVNKPVKYTRCGYECSDHASWHQAGIPASIPFEAAFGDDNPDIHTSKDTMDRLSLAHMTDYAKLATAFAVELAEPLA